MYDQGDFSFINCKMTKCSLQTMYDQITHDNMWTFFERDPPANTGYMFWNNHYLQKLSEKLDKDGHSGASFAFRLRHMREIKRLGWEHYVQSVLTH